MSETTPTKTTLEISPAEMELYRQAARARQAARRERLAGRLERAWQTARQAARLLKDDFGARRVAVFGSLLQERLFHERSDIDLAAWGLDERQYYRAVGVLQGLAPEFPIDLVEFEHAKPSLQERIALEGKDL